MTQGEERADVRGTLTQDGVIEVCGIGADTYLPVVALDDRR